MRICSNPSVLSFMNFKPRSTYGSTGSFNSPKIISPTAVLIASGFAPGWSAKPPLLRVVTGLEIPDDRFTVRGLASQEPEGAKRRARQCAAMAAAAFPWAAARRRTRPTAFAACGEKRSPAWSCSLTASLADEKNRGKERCPKHDALRWERVRRLELVGVDRFAAGLRDQAGEHVAIERFGDEMDGAVAQQDVGPVGMEGVDAPVVVGVDGAWPARA